MANSRETYLYEVLIRLGPDGLEGAHQLRVERVLDGGGTVLSERVLDPTPLDPADVAPLLGVEFVALQAQVTAAKADFATAESSHAEAMQREAARADDLAKEAAALAGQVATLQAEVERLRAAPAGSSTVISDRQFAQALALRGIISRDESKAWAGPGVVPAGLLALLQMIPDDNARYDAEMKLIGAKEFDLANPTTVALLAAYNASSPSIPIDGPELWAFASTLT